MAGELDTQTTQTGIDDTPEPSLRDMLDDAFAKHGGDDSGADAPPPKPQATSPAPAPAEGGNRDAQGRFAKAQPPADPTVQPPIAQAPAPIAQPPSPNELKAPASWKPAVREKWAALDPEIQAEIVRREGDMQRSIQADAQARNFEKAFEQIVRPYELFIRQENSTPLQAVQNLMQTAANLRVGTPEQKVAIVANIINGYGIDLQQLDTALAGRVNSGQMQQQPQQFRDPRLDQLLWQQQQMAMQAERDNSASVQNEVTEFAKSHEFFDDVRQQMGDLIEMHSRRGQALSMEDAYKMACAMHSDIPKILQQRAATPPAPSPAVLRAKRAAASVKTDGQPSQNGTVPKGDSLRASIEAAFDAGNA